jgi:uncharacterized protein
MNIPRKILQRLKEWTLDEHRKVLLLRGPRQVGKTYAVRQHAHLHYKHLLEVNLLSDKGIHSVFEGNIDIGEIVEALTAIYGIPVQNADTLVFLDEIQECPAAIEALRFFYEKRPDLHVLASGSLLEFALEEIPSFGVGRIQSLFMHPVSFDEYLAAAGADPLLSMLAKVGPCRPCVDPVHEKLLAFLRAYLFTGGLPEAVCLFLEKRDYHAVNRLIDHLRSGFEDDFGKYRKRVPTVRLREVFRSVSLQAGMKFVHSHAYPDAGAGPVHAALELLNKAGVAHKIYHTAANGLPLGGEVNIKRFKVIPFDHGLYQRAIGVTPADIVQKGFNPINKGALAEVYTGCALLAQGAQSHPGELFYWHREAKSSNAEVDYVVQVGDQIAPVEVKSATKGKMQSMQRFLSAKAGEGKNTRYGVRLSMENFGRFDNILVLPLYAVSQLERILTEAK